MQWLNKIVDELEDRHPDGEIVVSSGVSPSGTYHLGTLREVLTAEVVHRELKNRGRQSRHIHVVDDLDVFRKIPVGLPAEYEQYLGRPLCDIPAPDGSGQSYADYYLADLTRAAQGLHLDMEVMRAHEKYRSGYFVSAIEISLDKVASIKQILEDISDRKLEETWSPIQVLEDGYLKNRQFVDIDKPSKTITYIDKDGQRQTKKYDAGEVKLNWRVDWPARWWLLGVKAEPFGRDHATKGGSYDTGQRIARNVFGAEPPLPIPYDFINRSGETKKMSKSKGDTFTAAELLTILPPEVVWFFMLRYSPSKLLFFDDGETLVRLIDEFSELLAKQDKTADEKKLIELCMTGVNEQTISSVPFSHLVASYQASLKDPQKTIAVIARTEHAETAGKQKDIIIRELKFIDNWLNKSAPEEVKFDLLKNVPSNFSEQQKKYLNQLAEKIENAPADADGEWFHKAIYELKDTTDLEAKELFTTLYRVLIGKDSGPRAGWFLSILPREGLIKRLRLES